MRPLHDGTPSDFLRDLIDRRLTYSASGAAALLFVPLLAALLTGRIFTLDDLSSFHLPMRYLYQRALTAHHSLLWSSQLFSGFYVHAEGQIGAFHPLHLLLYAALPLALAFDLELILAYILAFAGMGFWLRRSGLTPASSIVGAIGFAFSGFMVLHLPHLNAIAVIAHVPWLLIGIDLSLGDDRASRRKGVVFIAVLFASQALLGYPQYIWMTALICLLYGLTRGHRLLFRLILGGAASVSGLMLGGIQLLPSVHLLATSIRKDVGTDFALTYSMHPLNLVQLVSPYLLLHRVYAPAHERIMHEFGVYNGALATVALVWSMVRYRDLPARRLALFGGLTCIVGFVLALGEYGGVYQWLTSVPLAGKFRAPARHLIVAHFGLAVLVAVMLEDIRRLHVQPAMRYTRQRWLWIPVLASICVAVDGWLRPQIWQGFPDQPLFIGGMLVGLSILGVTTLLINDAIRGTRSALVLLPWVFAIDLALWGYSYVLAGGMQSVDQLAASAGAPPAGGSGATVHQAARIPQLNTLLLHDLRVLRPYVGLVPPRRLTLSTNDELRVSGVHWVSAGAGWNRVEDPMPRVRLVRDWQVVNDPGALSGIDIRRTALITENLPAAVAFTGAVDLVVDEPGRIVVDVTTHGPALLVTTEAYDPGWRAVGGTGARLHTLPVYADYLGIFIDSEIRRVSVTFEPESMRSGVLVSLSGAMLIALITAFVSWKR